MDDDSICKPPFPLSIKHKLKESLCCFHRRNGAHFSLHHPPPSPSPSPSDVVWIKAKGPHDHSLSEIKEKCRTILGFPGAKHKRQSSVEFRYDPLSYAMNFEDEFASHDQPPLRNFSARLPAAVT